MKAINIKWETDGENVVLPNEVEIPMGVAECRCEDYPNCEDNSVSVNNYLSERFGWLVENYDLINN